MVNGIAVGSKSGGLHLFVDGLSYGLRAYLRQQKHHTDTHSTMVNEYIFLIPLEFLLLKGKMK